MRKLMNQQNFTTASKFFGLFQNLFGGKHSLQQKKINRRRCPHKHLSFVRTVDLGGLEYVFKCRTCGEHIYKLENELRVPYTQNPNILHKFKLVGENTVKNFADYNKMNQVLGNAS